MSSESAIPSPRPIVAYVEEGARVAAILLVWSAIAAFCTYGLSDVGGPGSLFATFGPQLGAVFFLTGVFNAVGYLLYRTVDYWHHQA